MYKDSDGSIWTLSNQNPDRILCQATDAKVRCFGKAEGITIQMPFSFLPDGNGGFWIGGDTSLLHWKMGAVPEIYRPKHLQSNVGQIGIRSLLEDSDGSLLVGIMSEGPGLGLERFQNGVLSSVILPNFDGSKLFVHRIMEDSDKNIWIATFGDGIYRIHGQTVDHFGRADGLSSDSVSDLYESDDGTVWAATTDGLDNFRDLPVTTFSTSTGRGPTGAASVMVTKEGTVWVANLGALDFVRNGAVSSVRVPGEQVSSLLEDRQGNIWVGVDDGLFIYKDGHFRRIPEPDHHPLGLVLGLTEDVDGNIWAECKGAQERRLIRIRDFKVREEFSQPKVPKAKAIAADPRGGIWLGAVTGELTFFREGIAHASPLKLKRGSWAYQIEVAPDGSVMTASDDGLVMLRDRKVQRMGKDNGLPCDGVNGFAWDDNGNLWLNTPCGFIEIPGVDVQRWWIHPDTIVHARLFDTLDGALPGRVSFNPAAKSPDGRLWFVNGTVLQMIDPSHVSGDGPISPVYVEAVVADRKQYKPQAGLQLPPLTRDLEIGYTSPSFLIPQKVKFRYRLDGHDRDWQDAGTRREAFYTDLGPGKYRFHVIACNNNGVWNEAGAALDFAIAPAFYQTVWFRAVGAVLFLAVLAGLFRLRLRHLERQRDALRKSEKELRDVIDTIPATVWSALPDGSNTQINKRFVEYTGLSAEQTAGSGWKAAVHPDDLERHAAKWMGAVATGKPHENEARFRRSDGQYRWHLDRGVPLRDEDGNIVKWYGVATDIEDRKHAEQKLRESEAYLAEAQRLSQTGSWAWNPATGDIRYWSEMCYRVLGFDPAGPLPRFEEFFQRIHPDDQMALRERFEKAIRDKADFEMDYRVVHPEKGIRDIHVVGHAVLEGSSNLDEFVGTVIDVTERKRAEEALQQSQMYLEEGQRVAHMGSWAFNAAGFEYWSTELFRIHGLDPSGEPPTVEEYLALVHPEDRGFMTQGITNLLADQRAFDFIKRIIRPDGEIRSVRCVGVPVMQGGTFHGFLGTGMDVTEQERLTGELRLSEQYLSEGQRLAHMGSWTYNPSGFFEYWSQELFKIYGLDPQKGAPTLEEYLATLHPQDRESMAETIKRMNAECCGCDVRKRIIRPDGELRYVRCVGIPVVEGDTLKGFLGTAMDITAEELLTQELERRQAYLAEAQKLTHTGSWAWRAADRKSMHLSEEWYRIYAFDPVKGAPRWEEYFERIQPEDRRKLKGIIEQAVMKKADYDQEFRILLPNGMVKWIHTVGHPIISDSGDLEGFAGSSTDITALKSAEQEREKVRQLEADLAHTNRVSVLGEMAASLAHEIKQPIAAAITSANSCIEWLAHEPPNLDRARAAAARIDKYGNRAAEIIDHIRSLYRKSPPQSELIDVNEIVREIFTLLQGEAIRYSVAMRPELAGGQPKIKADRVQLQQVFMNLMLNAIEAMRDEGGELTVRTQRQDGQLLFCVSDTGPGLPADNVDQIFSAFFTTKPQGSGMGLAISRSIVESHGGRLWATANDRRGATFHFTLPTEVP